MSAEYILSSGNGNVILCERGIRTFETSTRNTPDLVAIPIIKELSHLPVIFDPCHSTGKKELVSPMSAAALACGADGIIVEIHSSPVNASYISEQSLTCDLFAAMMQKIRQVVIAVDKVV
jgi:3-deoxy-7-phosphoheptulonate synthase